LQYSPFPVSILVTPTLLIVSHTCRPRTLWY